MASEINIPYLYPTLDSAETRSLTEGETATVAGTQNETTDDGFFSGLDDWWNDTTASISDAFNGLTQQAIAQETNDASKRITEVNDPQHTTNTQSAQQSFFEANKTPLLIGGAVVVGLVVLMAMRR